PPIPDFFGAGGRGEDCGPVSPPPRPSPTRGEGDRFSTHAMPEARRECGRDGGAQVAIGPRPGGAGRAENRPGASARGRERRRARDAVGTRRSTLTRPHRGGRGPE